MESIFFFLQSDAFTRLLLGIGVVLVALILAVLYGYTSYSSGLYNSDEYNIVFLDNSLFYFCKLEDFNRDYIACNEPYYLVRRNVTEKGKTEEKVLIRTPNEEEVYQPEGPFYIQKSKISYIAKVGDESAVIDYIQRNNYTTN
ncbi:MAG: hypothetical protein ACE5DX_04265 [Candidatus Dojkabacteria bacterium]